MLAGTGTISRPTSLNHVSSPSAIMSPTEPITRSLRSVAPDGVEKVPRPAWR